MRYFPIAVIVVVAVGAVYWLQQEGLEASTAPQTSSVVEYAPAQGDCSVKMPDGGAVGC
jgi:hypothetical protein